MRNFLYENEFCMQFNFRANQSHFHKNSFALRLALNQRHKGTGKWPDKQSYFPDASGCITLIRKKRVTFLNWHFYFVSEIQVVLILFFTYRQTNKFKEPIRFKTVFPWK